MSEPKEGEMGGKRKVDELAGKDSLADRLRRKRIETETNPEGGMMDAGEMMPGPDHYRGYTRMK